MNRPSLFSPLSPHVRVALLRELLRDGIPVRIRVTGNSMKPWIRPESLVRVQPCDAETLVAGDIAMLEVGPGVLLAHRVVRINIQAKTLVTKGDSCRENDAPFPLRAVLGRVIAVEEPKLYELDTDRHRTLARLVARVYPFFVRAKSQWLGSAVTTS